MILNIKLNLNDLTQTVLVKFPAFNFKLLFYKIIINLNQSKCHLIGSPHFGALGKFSNENGGRFKDEGPLIAKHDCVEAISKLVVFESTAPNNFCKDVSKSNRVAIACEGFCLSELKLKFILYIHLINN